MHHTTPSRPVQYPPDMDIHNQLMSEIIKYFTCVVSFKYNMLEYRTKNSYLQTELYIQYMLKMKYRGACF